MQEQKKAIVSKPKPKPKPIQVPSHAAQVDKCLAEKKFAQVYHSMMTDTAPCLDPLVFTINEKHDDFLEWFSSAEAKGILKEPFDWNKAAEIADICNRPTCAAQCREKKKKELEELRRLEQLRKQRAQTQRMMNQRV
jgi:hypothetical protein